MKFVRNNWKDILGTLAVIMLIVYLAMKANGADTKLTELQVCQLQNASVIGGMHDLEKKVIELQTQLDNIRANLVYKDVCDARGIKFEECSINVQTKEVTRKKPSSK